MYVMNYLLITIIMVKVGDFRKYPYIYHRQLLDFQRGGGFFKLEFQRKKGVFTIGNTKSWGGFHR